jgi:hypothetical protein
VNTEIEYLKQLETDLRDAAAREQAWRERASVATRIKIGAGRRDGNRWAKVAGVAAAFLIVAGAIGFVAGPGSNHPLLTADESSGGGVDGSGGRAVSREPDAGVAPGGEEPAAPAPSPAPGEGLLGIDYSSDADEFAVGDIPTVGEQQQDLSKIVRDGRIGVVVPDGSFGDAVGELTFVAEAHGGFILSSSTQHERSGTFVLRIPARRFDRALNEIRALGNVRFQTIEGEDVTAEFIDSQARLRILRARKALLFDLFQDADTTDEILRLASQLDDVHLRIEQMQGQIRFINNQVAEATLRVSIQERNAPKAAVEERIDNPDLGSSFDLAVQGFLRIVGAVIVGLGYLIPLTALGALVWLAVWLVRHRAARPA